MLNRMAVVVTARQPFLDWLRSVDPTNDDVTLAEVNSEPPVYLLPECVDDDAAARCVRRHCGEILEAEIDGWWTERRDWPAKLTPKIFDEWFEWRWYSMVVDLGEGELVEEEGG